MDLLAALRGATGAPHRELDRALQQADLTSPRGYAQFLLMHARVLPGLERWMAAQPSFRTLPWADQRFRTEALLADLRALDLTPPVPVAPQAWLEGAPLPGVCYVVEGSRNGASHIRNLLAASGRDFPLAFLSHGGDKPLWRSFTQWLAEWRGDETAAADAARAATCVFEDYKAALRTAREKYPA